MTKDVLKAYLQRCSEIHNTGGGTAETSYYEPLAVALNAIGDSLKPKVRCVMQLKNLGAGLPDGGFFTRDQFDRKTGQPKTPQSPARGVIEVKPPSSSVLNVAETQQVTDYWKQYGLVLVTNLREFLLIGRDENGQPIRLESFKLADTEDEFWSLAAHPGLAVSTAESGFEEYLRRVQLHEADISHPEELARFISSYAREALGRIDEGNLDSLQSLRSALEEALGMKFEGDDGDHFFRSTLVQTLFYGVFSAWVLWSHDRSKKNTDRFDWHDTSGLLQVPVIQALFHQVSNPARLKPLGLENLLDWAGNTLNRVNRSDFFTNFDKGQAVQHFYEPFLEEFDPDLRKQLGVWYTPSDVVNYMVERVDRALRTELGIADGLADPNVVVLDPATGTGSFLVAILERIRRTLEENGEGALTAEKVKKAARDRVFGFEILPAPFVVAHLQVGLYLKSIDAPLESDGSERAGIFLTNSLTGWEPLDPEKEKAHQAMLSGLPELLAEEQGARDVKSNQPILVVIGNPPYNAFAGTNPSDPSEQESLVQPFKDGLFDKWNIKKFNLDDLYVRFFRLAERRIAEQSSRGVICFISNFSFLSDPSFVVMRQRFLSEFDTMWFDNMNGDSRETGKRTPEGLPDPSVFSTESNRAGIRLGTVVSTLVRGQQTGSARGVQYREFWGVEKRRNLLRSLGDDLSKSDYQSVKPLEKYRFEFRPLDVSPEYDSWPRIIDLCDQSPISGLQEMRRGSLIDSNPQDLSSRMDQYFDSQTSWEELDSLHPGFTADAGGFDARKSQEKLSSSESFDKNNIRRYSLYPMDTRWAYYSTMRPLWNRSRPDLSAQVWDGNLFLVTRMTAERPNENIPVITTRALSDYHLLRPNAVAIPIQIKPNARANNSPDQLTIFDDESSLNGVKANISTTTRRYLESLGVTDADANFESASLVWRHTVAVAYSPAYLRENGDGVKRDWVRIPLPKSRELLNSSAKLGLRIIELLDDDATVDGVTVGSRRKELRVIGVVTVLESSNRSMNLDVGWGYHGRRKIVMPGPGKKVRREWTKQEHENLESGFIEQGLDVAEAFQRIGTTCVDVYLNDSTYWAGIPENIWDYRIGGYQVIKKWLSYRDRNITDRDLTVEEVEYVRDMARRLTALVLLQPELDANYQNIKESTYDWNGQAAT